MMKEVYLMPTQEAGRDFAYGRRCKLFNWAN